MPITIAGTPLRTSSTIVTPFRIDAGCELVQVDGDEDADGQRHQRGDADDHDRSDEGVSRVPRRVREAELNRILRDQVEVELAGNACRATEKMTMPSMPTAIAAASQASPSIRRLTARRRGEPVVTRSGR